MSAEEISITEEPQQYSISFQDIQAASKRISSLAYKTPVLTSASLNEICGKDRSLFFKVEALQRTGSFKFRGALNATLNLIQQKKLQLEEDEGPSSNNDTATHHVVTHSSGNHAAALALAAKLASQSTGSRMEATIVMPSNAPQIKVNGVRGFGGNIVFVENTNEAREERADAIVAEREATFIHPSENEFVIAGQGTACLEFVNQVQEMVHGGTAGAGAGNLDAVIIPVGGGGLAAGNTIALRGMLGPNVKIILAEPEELDDAKRSKDAGKLLGHGADNELKSVADGLKTTLGPNTWPIVRDLVDDIITVSEDDILRATKLIWERLKVCIEPSAGVGVAVALGTEFREKYPAVEAGVKNVGVILCGGNVDVVKIAKLMETRGV